MGQIHLRIRAMGCKSHYCQWLIDDAYKNLYSKESYFF